MENDEPRRFGRRAAIRTGLVVLASAPIVGAVGCGGGGLTCEPGSLSAAETQVRSSLHYVDTATNATRQCSGCALYTGNATACGTCSVVAGAIHPQGSCDSFVARS